MRSRAGPGPDPSSFALQLAHRDAPAPLRPPTTAYGTGKKQETNTGAKPKMPDYNRCTITCAFCGKRKHYEDECYHKQRLSAKLKWEDPGKVSGKGGGKSSGNDSGKGKSKGIGNGQDKSQGERGGGANRQPDKDNKNPDKNGGNPNPNPGGNSEPPGGQSGPTTRSQTQAQREQGAEREHEGGDDGNAKKRGCFMRMARKLQNKGFEVTCPEAVPRTYGPWPRGLQAVTPVRKPLRKPLTPAIPVL